MHTRAKVWFFIAAFLLFGKSDSESNNGASASRTKKTPPNAQSSQASPKTAPSKPKPRATFFLYIGGTADLEPYYIFSCKQLEREGVPEDINVPICLSLAVSTQTQHVTFATIKGTTMIIEQSFVHNGPPSEVFAQALSWASEFQHDTFGAVISNHGPTCRGLDLLISDTLNTSDTALRTTLTSFVEEKLKKPMAFLGFDACFQGSLENGVAASGLAQYIIASEQATAGGGWPYHLILRELKKGTRQALAMAQSIAQVYENYYKPLIDAYQLSVINMVAFEAVTQNVLEVSMLLNQLVEKYKKLAPLLLDVSRKVPHFNKQSFADLYELYRSLLSFFEHNKKVADPLLVLLRKALQQGLTLIKKCVVYSVHGTSTPLGGLSIFLPLKPTKQQVEWYGKTWWAQRSSWQTLLHSFTVL